MCGHGEFDRVYAAEQIRRSQHPIRRAVKHFYLENVLRDLSGRTIDFGCGAGQLLERLPEGSTGIEINPLLVETLRSRGLDVRPYDAAADDLSFSALEVGSYRSFVISHVLEHFADAAAAFRKICRACNRLGIDTIVAVVPGKKGFDSDPTHRTFVTHEWLLENGLLNCEGFHLEKVDYFPFNMPVIGDYFVFHEMKVVYRRIVTVSGQSGTR